MFLSTPSRVRMRSAELLYSPKLPAMPIDGSVPALFVFDANRLKRGDRGLGSASSLLLFDEGFRTSTKYQEDRPAAADIFGVAAFANGIIEDRIGCALEDDYFFRDPTLPGELPTSGNHGDRTSRQRVEVISPSLCSRLYRRSSAHRQIEPLTTRATQTL
jgi:hypothetical protein